MKISRLLVRVFVPSLLVVLVIMASGCQDNEIVVYGELPENVGYLAGRHRPTGAAGVAGGFA